MNKTVFNTAVSYSRALIAIFLSFYTTRIVLEALGQSDYGLYTVVGGVVAMLAFLNKAMVSTTQRFISVNLGKFDDIHVKDIFKQSVFIHFVIAILLVIVIEFIGIYFIENKLSIPNGRLDAALFVFHCVVATTFFTIISVPFDAVFLAYENFLFIAIITLLESVFKLLVALLVLNLDLDKLKSYGFLLMLSTILIRLIKQFYCYSKYKVTRINLFKIDFTFGSVKKQLSFAGWNLFGVLTGIGKNEGIAIVLNLFSGTKVNAAYGVGNQLAGQMNFFSTTIVNVMKPQIMKSEGGGDRTRMIKLIFMSCKYSYALIAFIAIPIIFEMDFILNVWLVEVPDYTVIFCKLILISFVVNQITMGVDSGVQAHGNIKGYMLTVGTVKLLTLPISYFVLKYGAEPYIVFIVLITIEAVGSFLRLVIARKLISLNYKDFFYDVFVKILVPTIVALLISYLVNINLNLSNNYINEIIRISSGALSFLIVFYLVSMNSNEKEVFTKPFVKYFKR